MESSILRVSQGHASPLTSDPSCTALLSPPSHFPAPQPLLQVLDSLLPHLLQPSPSCCSLHMNLSPAIPPSDPLSLIPGPCPQPLVTAAHQAPRPHQQRAVVALLPRCTSPQIPARASGTALTLLPAAALPSWALPECLWGKWRSRKENPVLLSPSVLAGDAVGLSLGS